MVQRLSANTIEALKSIAEHELQMTGGLALAAAIFLSASNKRKMRRVGCFVNRAPAMVEQWFSKLAPVVFKDALKEIEGALSNFGHADSVEASAGLTPPDLAGIAKVSKSEEAKVLYQCWTFFAEAKQSFLDACVAVGVSGERISVSSPAVSKTQSVVAIFMATQALVRELKPDQSRSDMVSAARKQVSDAGAALPAPLRLAMDGAIEPKRPAPGRRGA